MKLFSKQELIETMRNIFSQGWHKSVKRTHNSRNDGAVGNTLEVLLGISENNLPIPNASDWELKGQRAHTTSLVTLKHIEPSPIGAKIISSMLLPKYGWKHKKAGVKYPKLEMSFRSTTNGVSYTNRGFKLEVDRTHEKVLFVFDAKHADSNDAEVQAWLKLVEKRTGLGTLNPEPYWGFDDLKFQIGSKIRNCFYVIAESKMKDNCEYFLYKQLFMLSKFSFEKFLSAIENGTLLIDFDARTGHNHGTKFRIKQGKWLEIYNNVKQIL